MTGHKVNIIENLIDSYGIIWQNIGNVKEEATKQVYANFNKKNYEFGV